MPAESQAQQRAAGMALAAKKGDIEVSELKGAAEKMYENMSKEELEEFASGVSGEKEGVDKKAFLKGYADKISVEVAEDRPLYKRPVSGTVGRSLAPLYAATLGSSAFFRKGSDKEFILNNLNKFVEAEKNMKKSRGTPELYIQPGSVHPLEELKRIWRRKDIKAPTKALGTLTHPISSVQRSLMRADSYNPYSHSVSSFHKDPAILAHELGHAEDFGGRKYKGPYSILRSLVPVMLLQEALASSKAGKQFEKSDRSETEKKRLNRVLSGGFGSYAAPVISGGNIAPLLGGLAGQAAGIKWSDVDKKKLKEELKKRKEEKKSGRNKDE